MNTNLTPPCAYQGGKQRLAKQIVDIIFANEHIDNHTKFYDLCCGSGAFSLELINRGVHPINIVMVDASPWGWFYEQIGKGTFNMDKFKDSIDCIPKDITKIKSYAEELLSRKADPYDFLFLQACAFGSTATWIDKNGMWQKAGGLRNYWLPTATSNRRSPVNPMMPMPNSLYNRVKDIVGAMNYYIEAHNDYVENYYHWFDQDQPNNAIVYLDPPYKGTTGYGFEYNPYDIVYQVWNNVPIYISEGYKMDGIEQAWMLSKGRSKGNITGDIKKKPTEEWLNKFI